MRKKNGIVNMRKRDISVIFYDTDVTVNQVKMTNVQLSKYLIKNIS